MGIFDAPHPESALADIDLDPTTPVLVGVGIIDQRVEDAGAALEPIELMIAAARAAGADAGSPALLEQLDRILVPVGRWRYGDPGAMVGRAVGSPATRTVSAMPGVSQQTILSDAASAIAAGEITTALVVGGEAGYRLLRARIEGVELVDTEDGGQPDVVLTLNDPMMPPHERDRGLGVMPVGYYALIDSAWRYTHGRTVAEHRAHTAQRYANYSAVATTNPHGWDTEPLDADAVSSARMIAFPYGKHHVSNWSVDQASALLLTSVGEATRLDVPRSQWIFPQAFSEANHVVDVAARADIGRCPGAELAAAAVLDAAGCGPEDLDVAELYTCFPVAVDIYAEALELPDDIPWTVTGAMPFAGGPFNNFVLHSTAQVAQRLRAQPGRGLVTTVSGVLTKQGFAIWGSEPNPHGYRFVDVTEATAAAAPAIPVDPEHVGPAVVAAYTVMHDRAGPQAGVVVADLPDGRRTVAATSDPAVMAAMQVEEFCGRTVDVSGATFLPRPEQR